MMKLLVGNGATVEVRDVSDVIYRIDAEVDCMLPFHGYKILTDDEARVELEHIKLFGQGRVLKN